MSSEHETIPMTLRQPRRVVIVLVAALLIAGAVVSYIGIQHKPLSALDSVPAGFTARDPVVRIELPHEDFALPSGPHRARFQVSCTVCHSPRLAFTQPALPEKKWQEVVHKMVAVYGAPLGPGDEIAVVNYLTAVQGQAPP